MNFDPRTGKSQKFTLSWAAFDQIIQCLSQKSKEEFCLIALKIGTKFEGKLACVSKNLHEEFGKFSPEHLKVSKLGP